MLNVARCIFDTKLKKYIEAQKTSAEGDTDKDTPNLFGDDLKLNSELNKVTLTDAIEILKDKYDKKTVEVIQSLSISMQVSLFALYYSITDLNETCNMVNFSTTSPKKIDFILERFQETA